MKIAITGLQNSGKTTVFNALTGLNFETTAYSSVMEEPNIGVVKVPDERVDHLASLYNPKKTTYATIEYIDYIGLTGGDQEHNRKVFDLIKDVDAIVEVVRAFQDESVTHPEGDLGPGRDAGNIETELIFFDLELIEKRLARIKESAKRGKKIDQRERDLLLKCREGLEREIPLREAEFSPEEVQAMRHLQFLSLKPNIVLLNISEGDIGSDAINTLAATLVREDSAASVIPLSAKIEMEIAQLPPEEAAEFMKDLGIREAALNRLIRASYARLGLISFLTAGTDEVRAWTIRKGTRAQKAAGKIHSDIERGFIRAETVACDDFLATGNMAEARKKGLYRLEGKTYELKDGDIVNFRFNV